MATDEFGEKTELPTDRRRTQARERGNVPRSVDLTAAGLMLGAAAVFYVLAVPLCRTLAELTAGSLRTASPRAITAGDAVPVVISVAGQTSPISPPVTMAVK